MRLLCGVVVLGLVGCSVLPREGTDQTAQRLADLEAEVEALAREVSELQGQHASSAPSAQGAGLPASAEPAVELRTCLDPGRIDAVLSDTEQLGRLGRVLLHEGPDGAFDGYRLSGVRPDTLLSEIGLHNGDILHAVNGLPLVSVEHAMQAYTTLKHATRVELDLTRRGRRVRVILDVPCDEAAP